MLRRRAVLAIGALVVGHAAVASQRKTFAVTHTESEWRTLLTPGQYAVLRESATEQPGSSVLLKEHRRGVFACVGCDLDTFSSTTKFESGTGWPSFWRAMRHAVDTSEDRSLGMSRTAVHCSRCGGHLGLACCRFG